MTTIGTIVIVWLLIGMAVAFALELPREDVGNPLLALALFALWPAWLAAVAIRYYKDKR